MDQIYHKRCHFFNLQIMTFYNLLMRNILNILGKALWTRLFIPIVCDDSCRLVAGHRNTMASTMFN